MTLTYRSTMRAQVVIRHADQDGAARVARAFAVNGSKRQWTARIEMPNGQAIPVSNIYGDADHVTLALAQALHQTEREWEIAKQRGFRPEPQPLVNRNRSVPVTTPKSFDDLRQPIGNAPVDGIYKRS